jgi:hypothetical protein
MQPRFPPVLALWCAIFLLGGCSAKQPSAPRARFPEQPALALAKTLEQGMADHAGRRNIAVKGGWGFGRDDAVILTVPPRSRTKYCNTVPLESHLVSTRNEVEFIGTPPEGQRYVVVDYGPVARTLTAKQGRMHAVWRGRMILVSEKNTPALYKKVASLPLARRASFAAKEQSFAVPREFWFDVTETSTLNAEAAGETAGKMPPAKLNAHPGMKGKL